jgi:hypothetical protein
MYEAASAALEANPHSLAAITTLLKISESRRKLEGLDAPAKVNVSGGLKVEIVGAWNSIKDFVGKALDFLKNLFLNWTGPGLIIKHWDKIREGARTVVNKVKEFWNGFMDFFRGIPGGFPEPPGACGMASRAASRARSTGSSASGTT